MQRRQLDGDVGNTDTGREAAAERAEIGQSAGIEFAVERYADVVTPRWRRQSRANPSLNAEFPASREFTGNFIDSGPHGASTSEKKGIKSERYEPIP